MFYTALRSVVNSNLLFWKLNTVTITVKTGFSDKELI